MVKKYNGGHWEPFLVTNILQSAFCVLHSHTGLEQHECYTIFACNIPLTMNNSILTNKFTAVNIIIILDYVKCSLK